MPKSNSKCAGSDSATMRLAARLMLALIAHAIFVSVTHYHRSELFAATSPTLTAAWNDDGGSDQAPRSGNDYHCLSCCLQRNFVADVRTPAVILCPVAGVINYEPLLSEPHSAGSFHVPSDRAPPLV